MSVIERETAGATPEDVAGNVRRAVRTMVPLITATATALLAIGLFLTWRMGRGIAWSSAVAPAIPLLLALGCGSYGARFLRWHILARRVAPQLPVLTSLRIYMAGFAMGMTPGRVGEFLKFSLLRDATGVAELESVSIFPIERATEAATFLGLALSGALLGHLQFRRVGVGSIVTIAALPCLAIIPLAVRWLRKRKARGDAAVGSRHIESILRGLTSIVGVRALVPALLCAVAARCCDGLLFFTAAHAAGLALPLAGAAMAWGLAGLVGGLSLLPAGVGAVEASLVTTVIGLGGDATSALAAALIARVMTLWIWVPIGLWLAFRSTRVPAQRIASEPSPSR